MKISAKNMLSEPPHSYMNVMTGEDIKPDLCPLRSGYCRWSLRMKTQVIGWFYLIAGLSLIAAFVVYISKYVTGAELLSYPYLTMTSCDTNILKIFRALAVSGVITILALIPTSSILLLIGVRERNASLLKPFPILVSLFTVSITLVYLVMRFIGCVSECEVLSSVFPLISVLSVLIGLYSILVVKRYEKVLRVRSQVLAPKIHISHV